MTHGDGSVCLLYLLHAQHLMDLINRTWVRHIHLISCKSLVKKEASLSSSYSKGSSLHSVTVNCENHLIEDVLFQHCCLCWDYFNINSVT